MQAARTSECKRLLLSCHSRSVFPSATQCWTNHSCRQMRRSLALCWQQTQASVSVSYCRAAVSLCFCQRIGQSGQKVQGCECNDRLVSASACVCLSIRKCVTACLPVCRYDCIRDLLSVSLSRSLSLSLRLCLSQCLSVSVSISVCLSLCLVTY